jgi:predicted PurR-regulated permease PerM
MATNRLLLVIAVVLVAGALRVAWPVAMPVIAALVIVAAVWPVKSWLDRISPPWLSYVGTMAALVVVSVAFIGGVWMAASAVVTSFAGNQVRFNKIYDSLVTWRDGLGIELSGQQTYAALLELARTLLANTYSVLVYLGFILLLVILALPEVSVARRFLRETLSGADRHELLDAIDQVAVKVRRYLATTFLTSVLTGVAAWLWSLAVGLELALVWGVLNFLLNFIPLVGNIVGSIPPALYAVLQFQNTTMPLLVLAGFIVFQVGISNFIYPALEGRRLSLSPFAIMVALAFWTWMWGIAGALLAIPLTASLVIAADHFPATKWLARLAAR